MLQYIFGLNSGPVKYCIGWFTNFSKGIPYFPSMVFDTIPRSSSVVHMLQYIQRKKI